MCVLLLDARYLQRDGGIPAYRGHHGGSFGRDNEPDRSDGWNSATLFCGRNTGHLCDKRWVASSFVCFQMWCRHRIEHDLILLALLSEM